MAIGCGAGIGFVRNFIMTPLANFFSRHLPQVLVTPALSVTYAAVILALLLLGKIPGDTIIYINVGG